MNYGFWEKLPKPFFCLAPMYDVTDCAFREMVALSGRPDVMFTEFVSVDGLFNEKSREKLVKLHFGFTENQRPIAAQIWGTDPEKFRRAAQLIKQLGFDGIDINMGCPDKAVTRAGAGGALIKNPSLAKEMICAAKDGAGGLPVSVKTRIGYEKNVLETWLTELLAAHPAAVTIHARTVKNMSRVPADWKAVKLAAEIAKNTGVKIIGNGDARSLDEAKARVNETGCDGVMIGRGALGNYWFFSDGFSPSLAERLRAVARHAELFEEYYCTPSFGSGEAGRTNLRRFVHIRKHLSAFAKGFPGAQDLRVRLLAADNAGEVNSIMEEWIKSGPQCDNRDGQTGVV